MHMPFTADQFVAVFTTYNHAIGPMPLVAYGLAIASIGLVFRRVATTDRVIALTLAALWGWTGIAYHLLHFTRLNPAARIFGVLFVLQAAFFAAEAFRGRLHFRFSARDFRSRMGLVMVAFSMVVYPLLGMLAGHGYPNGPAFGVTPCPLVIFTFGLLLLTERSMPKYLLAIPLALAFVGATAAMSLGIREDTGLLVSGLIATTVLAARRAQSPDQPDNGRAGGVVARRDSAARTLHAAVHKIMTVR